MRGKERPGVAAWEGVRGRASCAGLNAHLPFQVADNLTTTTPTSGSHSWCPQVLFWEKGLVQGSLFNTETKPAVTSLRLLQLNIQPSMSCFQFPDIAWTWKLLNEANCFGSSVGDSHVDPFSGSQSAAGHSARSLLQGPRFGRETPWGPVIDWLLLCRVAASMQMCCATLKYTVHFQACWICACSMELIVHLVCSSETHNVILSSANEHRV